MVGTDICEVEGLVLVDVVGDDVRTVPVHHEWADAVLAFARESGPRPYFRPERTRITRGDVLAFIDRCTDKDEDAKFTIRRLRVTWIVGHLAAGVPIGVLARAAGVGAGHITKYLRFVPEPNETCCPTPAVRGDLMAMAFQPVLPLGTETESPNGRRPRVGPDRLDDGLVWDAISLIDGSPLVETIEQWQAEDRRGPGGRPATFPTRALLVAMLLCALTNQPMLAERFTDVLFRQISTTMRHALGVPSSWDRTTSRAGRLATATSAPGSTASSN